MGIFRRHKENQAQELNGGSRWRRGQLPHPDFMLRLQPLWCCQLRPTTWPLVCLRGQTGGEYLTLLGSALLCSYCWDDLLKLLSICPPACLSGCTAHLPAHWFIWIWSCPLSSVPGLSSIAQVWSCSPSPRTSCQFVTSLLVSQLRSHAISDVELISIMTGIREPVFVLAKFIKKSSNVWQIAAMKLWYLWNQCSINSDSMEIHKCFIYISKKTHNKSKKLQLNYSIILIHRRKS